MFSIPQPDENPVCPPDHAVGFSIFQVFFPPTLLAGILLLLLLIRIVVVDFAVNVLKYKSMDAYLLTRLLMKYFKSKTWKEIANSDS